MPPIPGGLAGLPLVQSETLATFFGYAAEPLFDPRVVYDSTWNRWIVTAVASQESSTVQRLFIAVSTTADPTGSFFMYNLNVTFFTGDFFDFPQLGMDQDAVLFTANIFNGTVPTELTSSPWPKPGYTTVWAFQCPSLQA